MPYKEKEITKKYFLITEACDIINQHIEIKRPDDMVVPSKLRYWESRFKSLRASKVNSSGVRKYTPEKIQRIILFTNIINTGLYTIDGAVQEFNKAKKYVKPDEIRA